MLTRERTYEGHTTRLTVTRGPVGWDAREEVDSQVIRSIRYTDWHRVERAVEAFATRVGAMGARSVTE